jgi:hypothetical protein
LATPVVSIDLHDGDQWMWTRRAMDVESNGCVEHMQYSLACAGGPAAKCYYSLVSLTRTVRRLPSVSRTARQPASLSNVASGLFEARIARRPKSPDRADSDSPASHRRGGRETGQLVSPWSAGRRGSQSLTRLTADRFAVARRAARTAQPPRLRSGHYSPARDGLPWPLGGPG